MATQTLQAPPATNQAADAACVELFKQGVPGIYRGIPAEVYHRLAAVSSSHLKRIHTHSPKHAKAVMDNPDLISGEALDVGEAAHSILLTPTDFESKFVCGAQCEASVKATGLRCENSGVKVSMYDGDLHWLCGVHGKGKTCEYAVTGKTVLTQDEYRRVRGIHDAVWANDRARDILEAATDFELSVLWTDPETGLLNKARLDILCGAIGVLPDLKTCRSVKWFEKQAWDMAYHIQLAHYRRTAIVAGIAVDIPTIIAVENEEPFDVAVYRPTDRFMELGIRDLDAAMKRFAECHRTGVWPGHAKGTLLLDAPEWAK